MRSHSSGFAILMAVGMVGLLAVVLLGLTTFLAADARRTDDVEMQAQLDQLLLAGAALVAGPNAPATDIDLPLELRQRGAALTMDRSADGDTHRVVITATIDTHTAQQTIHLQRAGDGWEIIDATR